MYPYEAIITDLLARIKGGPLQSGDYLDPIMPTARQYKVDDATVSRAYRALVDLGMIEKVSGRGYRVVTADKPDVDLAATLVPDNAWSVIEPLIRLPIRQGGVGRIDERIALAAMVFILMNGRRWSDVPAALNVERSTAARRFRESCRSDLWQRLQHAATTTVTDPVLAEWCHDLSRAALGRWANRRRSAQ